MPSSDYVKLERRLVLAAWACHVFGYTSNHAMLDNLREVEEGYDSNGRSYLVQAILARGSKCRIPAEVLHQYDANIRLHLKAYNRRRKEPITLRYFQHLALLSTELFLDNFFYHEKELRRNLN